jgi:hypothetical protein
MAPEYTRRLARDFFESTSPGKVPVKDKEEVQKAYKLVWTEETSSLPPALARGPFPCPR